MIALVDSIPPVLGKPGRPKRRPRELYGDRAYLGSGYQREVAARVRLAARRHGLDAAGANTAREMPDSPGEGRSVANERAEQLTLL